MKEKLGADADERPCIFVFHGGSGSSEEDIATAVKVRFEVARETLDLKVPVVLFA